ncbi:MAG: ABC transporter ATP-binding protein [Pseudomonadota bacterium]
MKKNRLESIGNLSSLKGQIISSVSFLWQYTQPYLKKLVTAFLFSLPLIAIGGIIPWAFKNVTEAFTQNEELGTIMLWMAVGLIAVSFRSLLEIITRYIMTILHVRLSNDIRNDIYEYIQKNSMTFHVQHQSGELASLVVNDSQAAAAGVLELYTALWQSPATIVCLVSVMLYFNPILSVFAICSVPLISLLVTKAGKRAQKAEKQFLDRQSKILGWVIESLINVKQVKSFNLEHQREKQFMSYGEELVTYRKKALLSKLVISPITEISSSLTLIIMGGVAYYQLSQGYTTSGEIIGCLTAAFSLKKPIKMISNSFVTLQTSIAAISRISWIVGNKNSRQDLTEMVEPLEKIIFDCIGFSYDGRQTIFKDASFTIHRGEKIALVGASGSGKTTLIDLLISFFPCQSGSITINQLNLSKINPDSWRKQIGIVTQEPFLFDTSIEENIRMGNPEASSDHVFKAAQMAGCKEIIDRLPQGIKTCVGERGSRLSGGERKRVALARALVRPISILILDEATGELDQKAEDEILALINSLSLNMTVIHVSHRKIVLDYCDRALLIENGRVLEIGIKECKAQMANKKNTSRESRRVAAN